MEKSKTENDQKKLQALINEYSREKEEKRQLLRQESVSSSDNSDQQQQQVSNQFQTLFKQQQNLPVYDYLRNTGAINILENLQSRLKEKEGEIAQLQAWLHIDSTWSSNCCDISYLFFFFEEKHFRFGTNPRITRQRAC